MNYTAKCLNILLDDTDSKSFSGFLLSPKPENISVKDYIGTPRNDIKDKNSCQQNGYLNFNNNNGYNSNIGKVEPGCQGQFDSCDKSETDVKCLSPSIEQSFTHGNHNLSNICPERMYFPFPNACTSMPSVHQNRPSPPPPYIPGIQSLQVIQSLQTELLQVKEQYLKTWEENLNLKQIVSQYRKEKVSVFVQTGDSAHPCTSSTSTDTTYAAIIKGISHSSAYPIKSNSSSQKTNNGQSKITKNLTNSKSTFTSDNQKARELKSFPSKSTITPENIYVKKRKNIAAHYDVPSECITSLKEEQPIPIIISSRDNKPKTVTPPPRNHSTHENFIHTTLIIGDSSLKKIKVRGLTKKTRIQTVPGGTISDIANVLLKMDISRYKNIIVHVGTNDIHKSADTFINEYDNLLNIIYNKSGSLKIVVSGLCPKMDMDTYIIDELNDCLYELTNSYDLNFVDYNFSFYFSNGNVNHNFLLEDDLHLSSKGTSAFLKSINAYTYILPN